LKIAGEDFDKLVNLTANVKNAIVKSGIQGIEELKSDLVLNKPEIVIDIDREQAAREGISTLQIAGQIRGALFGTEVSKFRDDKDDYPIMVRLKEGDRGQVEKAVEYECSVSRYESRGRIASGTVEYIDKDSLCNYL
jgi:multidrug efflux pump